MASIDEEGRWVAKQDPSREEGSGHSADSLGIGGLHEVSHGLEWRIRGGNGVLRVTWVHHPGSSRPG